MRSPRFQGRAMTLRRDAVSIEHALDIIAARLTWPEVARICGVKETFARAWAHPGRRERLPAQLIPALDLAYAAAGGGHYPLNETLATLMDVGERREFACQIELSKRSERAMIEVGQASAALFTATRPGATDSDRAYAARQVEEGAAALNATQSMLLAGGSVSAPGLGLPQEGGT